MQLFSRKAFRSLAALAVIAISLSAPVPANSNGPIGCYLEFHSNFEGSGIEVQTDSGANQWSLYWPEDNPSLREDYQFYRWTENMDGTGASFDLLEDFPCSGEPQALYAQWIPKSDLYRHWNEILTPTRQPAVGQKVWASAFERYLDEDLVTGDLVDEYVYRLTLEPNVPNSSVDLQSIAGYSRLSPTEQADWYRFDLLDPNYEFTWVAFLCVNGDREFSKPLQIKRNYFSLEDGLMQSGEFNWTYRNQTYEFMYSNFDPHVTQVGRTDNSGFASGVSVTYEPVLLGRTEVIPSCVQYSDPEVVYLTDSDGNRITSKEFTIPESINFEDAFGQLGAISSLGVTIGVTGQRTVQLNAALWGLSTIGQANTSPMPAAKFDGPLITSFSNRVFTTGNLGTVKIFGERLNLVSRLKISGKDIDFTRAESGEISFTMPQLTPGVYDLTVYYSGGAVLTHQDAFRVQEHRLDSNRQVVTFSNFIGDRFVLPAKVRAGISSVLSQSNLITKVTCIGSTSGRRATAFDTRLATARANQACAFVKRLRPEVLTEIEIKPAAGLGSRYRSVSLRLQG